MLSRAYLKLKGIFDTIQTPVEPQTSYDDKRGLYFKLAYQPDFTPVVHLP